MKLNGLVGQSLDAPQRFGIAVAQVVHNHDFMACVQEFDASVAADVACSAGYKDSHGLILVWYGI
jgi:hypothetical protein